MIAATTAIAVVLGVTRVGAGLLLAVSAWGKLAQDFGAGVSDVLGYRLVGRRTAEVLAFALPVVEMVLGACLVMGVLPSLSGLLAAVLLACLAVAAASVLARGIATDCGCWGTLARRRVGPVVVVRNLVLCLLLLADALLVGGQRLVFADQGSRAALTGMGVVLLLLVVQRWDSWRSWRARAGHHADDDARAAGTAGAPSATRVPGTSLTTG